MNPIRPTCLALLVALVVLGAAALVAASMRGDPTGPPAGRDDAVPTSDRTPVDDAVGEPAEARTGPALERGTRVEVPAPIGADRAVLVGRLLGRELRPLVDASALGTIRSADGRAGVREFRTDSDGRFQLVLPAPQAERTATLEVRVVKRDAGALGATVPMPKLVPGGRVALGDLQLRGLPRIAWGRVLDDAGHPVASASVDLQCSRPLPDPRVRHYVISAAPDASGARAAELQLRLAEQQLERALVVQFARSERDRFAAPTSGARGDAAAPTPRDAGAEIALREKYIAAFSREIAHSRLVLAGPQGPRASWQDIGGVATTTREDGTFELFADAPQLPLRVRATAEGHLPAASDEIAAGASVVLTVARAASVHGGAVIAGWMPTQALRFDLVPREGRGARASARVLAERGPDGRESVAFAFEQVHPGEYDLLVQVRGLPKPIHRIDRVTVLAGRREHDPRLAAIDLTGRLYRYQLRAVDDRGAALDAIQSPLLVRMPGPGPEDEPRYVGFPWRSGGVEIFSASPRLDVTLLAVGYRLRTTTVSHGRRDLRFERLHPVEIVLPDARALCGAGRKVRVSMILTTGTDLPGALSAVDQRSGDQQSYSRWHLSKSGGAWLGAGDVVRVPLIRNGTYQVILRLHEDGVPGDASRTLGNVDVILDGPMPQRLVVPVDPNTIEDALRDLRRRRPS